MNGNHNKFFMLPGLSPVPLALRPVNRVDKRKTANSIIREEREYAVLAESAYKDDGEERIKYVRGRTDIKWGLLQMSTDENAAWIHPTLNTIVIAYRGTATFGDFATDLALVFGVEELTARFKDSVNFFDKVRAKYPSEQFSIDLTGHSLGGSICESVFQHRHEQIRKVHIFNAGAAVNSVKTGILTRIETDLGKARKDKVTNHVMIGDPISMLKKRDPTSVVYAADSSIGHPHTIAQFTSQYDK